MPGNGHVRFGGRGRRNRRPKDRTALRLRPQLSPLDGIAANHLFRFVGTAYETRSLVITSNLAFEQWTNFLPDATSATAILDRFLHHAEFVVLSGESYRLREARSHPHLPERLAPTPSVRRRGAEKA
jgi:hypothetical protein